MSSQQYKSLTSTPHSPLTTQSTPSSVVKTTGSMATQSCRPIEHAEALLEKSQPLNRQTMNELENSLVNGDVRALIQAVNVELERNMQKLGEQLDKARSKLRSSQ